MRCSLKIKTDAQVAKMHQVTIEKREAMTTCVYIAAAGDVPAVNPTWEEEYGPRKV